MLAERPARQEQIAVTAVLQFDVELEQVGGGVKSLDELTRLIVVLGSRDVSVHFLKANQVGVLILDDLDNPVQAVATITSADTFMYVVTEQSHDLPC